MYDFDLLQSSLMQFILSVGRGERNTIFNTQESDISDFIFHLVA